ncbi:hypothetical protein JM18_009368 [Phytophthora kernoviae]|uniref:FYVE-type domain-containing protein n=2 Tax=Phytophthora kernoviae TaxID=325452 RepID=A0A921S9M0_9STRA|nr:hypothetical protein G195_011136 [Phytophthora kernoviae 00238/432]KAG2506880.1 hypothetical protein JM18_009368 [Phytophthora kernoviae]
MSNDHLSSRRSNSSDSASTVVGPVSVAGTTNGYGFRSAGGDALSIEMQFLNPRRRFPLADEYLPLVYVTHEQVEDLRETCEQLMADALELAGMFAWEDSNNNELVGEHRDQWKVHYQRPHVTLYRKKRGKDAIADELEDATDDSNGGLRHFVVSGQIHDMSLEDVEYGLYCDATLDERAVMTDLYRELFLDAAVLRSFETQTPEDPFHFFGIKWLAHLSPADKFISPRDFAFVEYSQRAVGPKGEPLLVKVQHSLSSKHVDAMNRREFDLVRAQMSCTTVYRHDKRANNVQVIARGHLDPCGNAPTIMTRAFLTRLAPTLVEVAHSADVKYIMRHGLVLPKEAFFARRNALKAHGRHRLQCTACGKRFGRLKRHLTQCRSCGEAACGHCLMTYTLCLPNHERRDAEHPTTTGFHEMNHSIGEQNALMRSLQSEYAKMRVGVQRSHSNPQEMRQNRLAEWQATEHQHTMALSSPNLNDIDSD